MAGERRSSRLTLSPSLSVRWSVSVPIVSPPHSLKTNPGDDSPNLAFISLTSLFLSCRDVEPDEEAVNEPINDADDKQQGGCVCEADEGMNQRSMRRRRRS
ncbi:hypothetical protein JOB18_017228 [Solea senegalensis]|uniref:Uncharacterized protein n=1 Tax=Solea senegalensis TaxID=28829 RepID=A0AAV6RT59_SOLSE|nr:hypothetical protein JOB18_017228 [Solea senegalensis]